MTKCEGEAAEFWNRSGLGKDGILERMAGCCCSEILDRMSKRGLKDVLCGDGQAKKRAEKDSSRVRVPEKEEVDASGRVERIMVGSDGLVRNAKGGAGLLEPIDGA